MDNIKANHLASLGQYSFARSINNFLFLSFDSLSRFSCRIYIYIIGKQQLLPYAHCLGIADEKWCNPRFLSSNCRCLLLPDNAHMGVQKLVHGN